MSGMMLETCADVSAALFGEAKIMCSLEKFRRAGAARKRNEKMNGRRGDPPQALPKEDADRV